MMKRIGLTVALVLAAGAGGCSSDKPIPNPAIAACPERMVSLAQANQRYFDTVKVGQTSSKGLSDLDGLRRTATFEKAGEASLEVKFYQTGIPGCPWLMAAESLTPVVVKDKVIVAMGVQAVRDMTAHGWVLKEAQWPWQDYNFGYLPRD